MAEKVFVIEHQTVFIKIQTQSKKCFYSERVKLEVSQVKSYISVCGLELAKILTFMMFTLRTAAWSWTWSNCSTWNRWSKTQRSCLFFFFTCFFILGHWELESMSSGGHFRLGHKRQTGNHRTWRKPTAALGEYLNSTYKVDRHSSPHYVFQ